MPSDNSKLVYSTDRPVGRKDRPAKKTPQPAAPPLRQKVTVRLDRKGRGGKTVTVIEGLRMPQKEMKSFLGRLKSGLGTGGAVKGALVEIQGEHRNAVMSVLEEMGCRPKRSGG